MCNTYHKDRRVVSGDLKRVRHNQGSGGLVGQYENLFMSGSDGAHISEVFQPDFPNDFTDNKWIGRPLFLLSGWPFRLGLAVGCIPQVACLCFSVLRDSQWPSVVLVTSLYSLRHCFRSTQQSLYPS